MEGCSDRQRHSVLLGRKRGVQALVPANATGFAVASVQHASRSRRIIAVALHLHGMRSLVGVCRTHRRARRLIRCRIHHGRLT